MKQRTISMIFCALAIVFLGSFLVLGLTALGGDEWHNDELFVVKMWVLATCTMSMYGLMMHVEYGIERQERRDQTEDVS